MSDRSVPAAGAIAAGATIETGCSVQSLRPLPDAELIPAVGPLTLARTWSGLMPFSLDGRAVIGPVPDHDGLFLAGGLASSGFGRGPMTGHLIAELVLGNDPGADPGPVLPDRFS